MLAYPHTATLDTNDTWLIVFPDVPEATGVADTEAEIPAQAFMALAVAFEVYVDQRRAFPLPSEVAGQHGCVVLPVLFAAKVKLANEMVAQDLRKADLVRLLDIHRPQVDRLLDPLYSSRIEAVEDALKALGKSLSLEMGSAALPSIAPHIRDVQMHPALEYLAKLPQFVGKMNRREAYVLDMRSGAKVWIYGLSSAFSEPYFEVSYAGKNGRPEFIPMRKYLSLQTLDATKIDLELNFADLDAEWRAILGPA